MADDTIERFEQAAKPRKEMSVLVASARKSFVLIEPWSYAKFASFKNQHNCF
jgi:hypothetical protein